MSQLGEMTDVEKAPQEISEQTAVAGMRAVSLVAMVLGAVVAVLYLRRRARD